MGHVKVEMDLDLLFAIKDFPTREVRIPCFSPSDEKESKDTTTTTPTSSTESDTTTTTSTSSTDLDSGTERGREQAELVVHIGSSRAASTDYDLTGQILWPVSVLLGHYLASQCFVELQVVSPSSTMVVVELGAGGTGLPGLVVAHRAAILTAKNTVQVILTDGNPSVLELLQSNVDRQNFSQQEKLQVSSQELVWGDRKQLLQLKERLLGPVDVIVAADVVQWPSVLEPLLWTVQAILHFHHDEDNISRGKFLLGLVSRAASTVELFFHLAEKLGFVWNVVPRIDYLYNGTLPPPCQEAAGRPIDLYELTLKPRECNHSSARDACEPFLLQNNSKLNDLDTTLGSSFANTLSRPC